MTNEVDNHVMAAAWISMFDASSYVQNFTRLMTSTVSR